jgi:hypothetical protein
MSERRRGTPLEIGTIPRAIPATVPVAIPSTVSIT